MLDVGGLLLLALSNAEESVRGQQDRILELAQLAVVVIVITTLLALYKEREIVFTEVTL